MYLLSSELRSNYKGESRIHVCAFAKPLVLPGYLPYFPTIIYNIKIYLSFNNIIYYILLIIINI